MHLLRAVPGGLSGGRDRGGSEFRIRHRNARGTLLRQGTPSRERRPLGTRDRQEHRARRAISLMKMSDLVSAVIPGREGANPESPTGTLRSMKSGFTAARRPGMTTESLPTEAVISK